MKSISFKRFLIVKKQAYRCMIHPIVGKYNPALLFQRRSHPNGLRSLYLINNEHICALTDPAAFI
ncbi:hypothetical protein PaecuDRAFT_3048 [Paenibacillus curdlanolyticus YK9]|uniref:Uncharacterized protein n=1 Tax=Paenibacillus curdlanolyticus YK9 TaxID=717606 RepID=E0IBK9_9BACL|nr:hypothetical protein PaecuDRAFT_3048 [Paenibacillus curdlanolyticus YK9]